MPSVAAGQVRRHHRITVIRATAACGPPGVNRDRDSDSGRVTRISGIRSTDRGTKRAYNPLTWER